MKTVNQELFDSTIDRAAMLRLYEKRLQTDSLLSVNRNAEIAAMNVLKRQEASEITGFDPDTGLPSQPEKG